MHTLSLTRFQLFVCILFLGGVIGVTDAAETWQALEVEVFQIAELIVQSVLKEDGSEEEIQPLRDEISQLETQFSSFAQQCPSTEICTALQYVISTAQEMANFVPGSEFSVEERGKIAFLRQAMHNYRTMTRSQETTNPDPQLQFQIGYAYLPAGTKQFQDLKNGGVMHSGDLYKVFFIPGQESYVYIFQANSSGRVYGLFPLEDSGGQQLNLLNPVQKGQTYFVPARDKSLKLDNQPGEENLYFLAFLEPQPTLEPLYEEIQTNGSVMIVLDSQPLETTSQPNGGKPIPLKLQQYLEGACEGCIQKLTFTHE